MVVREWPIAESLRGIGMALAVSQGMVLSRAVMGSGLLKGSLTVASVWRIELKRVREGPE